MDPFSDMGSTPISSTILQKAMRDLFEIAHGFFIRIFPQGVRWFFAGLAGAGWWRFIAPQGAQKRAAGLVLPGSPCCVALLCGCFCYLVIWKERVMGAA